MDANMIGLMIALAKGVPATAGQTATSAATRAAASATSAAASAEAAAAHNYGISVSGTTLNITEPTAQEGA